MNHTGLITGSTRTTAGAVLEIIVCAALAAGTAFIVVLVIAFFGGLQWIAELTS